MSKLRIVTDALSTTRYCTGLSYCYSQGSYKQWATHSGPYPAVEHAAQHHEHQRGDKRVAPTAPAAPASTTVVIQALRAAEPDPLLHATLHIHPPPPLWTCSPVLVALQQVPQLHALELQPPHLRWHQGAAAKRAGVTAGQPWVDAVLQPVDNVI